MKANTKKYLTFGAVLVAVAFSGWSGARYLQDVRREVLNARENAVSDKAPDSTEIPSSAENAE